MRLNEKFGERHRNFTKKVEVEYNNLSELAIK